MSDWINVKKTRLPKWKTFNLNSLVVFPNKPNGHWHYANLLARLDEDIDPHTKARLHDAYQMYCIIIERNNNLDYLEQFNTTHM